MGVRRPAGQPASSGSSKETVVAEPAVAEPAAAAAQRQSRASGVQAGVPKVGSRSSGHGLGARSQQSRAEGWCCGKEKKFSSLTSIFYRYGWMLRGWVPKTGAPPLAGGFQGLAGFAVASVDCFDFALSLSQTAYGALTSGGLGQLDGRAIHRKRRGTLGDRPQRGPLRSGQGCLDEY